MVADILIAYEFGTCCVHSCAVYALWVTAATAYAGQHVDMPKFVCEDISCFAISLTFVCSSSLGQFQPGQKRQAQYWFTSVVLQHQIQYTRSKFCSFFARHQHFHVTLVWNTFTTSGRIQHSCSRYAIISSVRNMTPKRVHWSPANRMWCTHQSNQTSSSVHLAIHWFVQSLSWPIDGCRSVRSEY